MIDEQTKVALEKSEQHWLSNEVSFVQLGTDGERNQLEWFDWECQADKCALCEKFIRARRSPSDPPSCKGCPLDGNGRICCDEWMDLRYACRKGTATLELVHAVTARIQLELSKLREVAPMNHNDN